MTVPVVGFLVVLEFASGLLQGWLPPLLPGILRQYGTTAADLNWVSAVYLLSSTVCVPLVAVAPTFGILLLGRAVQGPLGAFLPLEFAIVREHAEERAGRVIGLLVG